jgi:hypothetical protein
MKNNFLLCARPDLILVTAKIQTFFGTSTQELGSDSQLFLSLINPVLGVSIFPALRPALPEFTDSDGGHSHCHPNRCFSISILDLDHPGNKHSPKTCECNLSWRWMLACG